MSPRTADVLLLSLGTTRGLRIADAQLVDMLAEAGASVDAVGVRLGTTDRLRRGYPVNDVVEAIAARRALRAALRRRPGPPRAVIFSSTTAALLAGRVPAPYAVWLDSPARLNRPGWRNGLVHLLERRSLAAARLVLALSPGAVAALPTGAAPAVVIAPPLPAAPPRRTATPPAEPLVVAYTPDPKAKDLALVCQAWARTHARGARLVVTGIPPERARAFLQRRGVPVPDRVELAGMLAPEAFAELLGRATAFLSAARWEDFGQAPLQALDAGAAIVAAPAGGPFPALAIARELQPAFVAPTRAPDAVAAALQHALGAPESALADYRRAARARLEPYRRAAQVERLRAEVLPALLGG